MSRNSKLQKAVRLGLGFSAGLMTLAMGPGAYAQEEGAKIEEIVTTGSRIKRADLESASPVTVLTRAEILAAGITDVGDLIQSMPSMSGSPIGTTTNNGGNGAVLIDLRGMGSARTLTLINGQRTVDGGDFQTIPATMIERVEILKDGASAVYGADAVSGVVNIITRRDYQGFEVGLQTANWFDSKGKQDTVNFIGGTEFAGGNFTFGAEYVNQEEAYQADAPWEYFKDSFYIYPEGCENNLTAPYPEGCYRIGSSRVPESRLPFATQGLFHIGTTAANPYEAGLMTPGAAGSYNYAPVNYIQTPYERTNLFAEAHFDLTDKIRLNTEVRANFRESRQELAPLPYTGGDPMHNGFYDLDGDGEVDSYTGISEANYYLRQAIDTYNAANGTSLIYEPVVNPRRRMIETKRAFEQEITQFQFVAGLEGSLDNGMDWDLFMNRGYRSRQDVDYGQFSGARLDSSLGPSADLNGDGQPECYAFYDAGTDTYSGLINGCVPLNMFGGGSVVRESGAVTSSSLTQDMIDYVSVDLVDQYLSTQSIAGGSISGSAFALPGGDLGWAAGFQWWEDTFKYTPDSGKQTGAVTGNVGAGTTGSLTTTSFFAEVLAPVFDNGSQEIMLKGGVRYDDFNVFDSETTFQFGVEFQAIEDLKLRATYGSVYRAPTIGDLYGGVVDSFPQYVDPCTRTPLPAGCAQVGVQTDNQVRAAVGGNVNLIPESGDTYTVGLVYTPTFGEHGFTMTLDYWSIELEDGISSLGVQYILDDCYENQNADACALVTRASDYSVALVRDTQLNVSESTAKGIDT
ncbi:MAG: TonB-dependent receptor, partial [Chromatiales bacterium]|nr:TonB-dependent receptor [Chromatiales bacterium]